MLQARLSTKSPSLVFFRNWLRLSVYIFISCFVVSFPSLRTISHRSPQLRKFQYRPKIVKTASMLLASLMESALQSRNLMCWYFTDTGNCVTHSLIRGSSTVLRCSEAFSTTLKNWSSSSWTSFSMFFSECWTGSWGVSATALQKWLGSSAVTERFCWKSPEVSRAVAVAAEAEGLPVENIILCHLTNY